MSNTKKVMMTLSSKHFDSVEEVHMRLPTMQASTINAALKLLIKGGLVEVEGGKYRRLTKQDKVRSRQRQLKL